MRDFKWKKAQLKTDIERSGSMLTDAEKEYLSFFLEDKQTRENIEALLHTALACYGMSFNREYRTTFREKVFQVITQNFQI